MVMSKGLGVVAVTAMAAWSQTIHDGRPATTLQTPAAVLVIDLGGGSIVDFHMPDHGLNPLRWLGPADEKLTLRPMAHFLCLDRWGQPSASEGRNGMPYHGEATRVMWQQEEAPSAGGPFAAAAFSAMLPMAGLEVRRTVRLARNAACFIVSETVTNRNKLGRPYNMVQHPTIGPPFLDETTLVDANAGKGFMQSSPMPNPEEPAISWPAALKGAEKVDLRRLTSDPLPAVVSFVIDAEYGWVTAITPSKGLLLGYLWKTSEYPWLNIWRHVDKGKPLARGLEFGTTGLHQPFGVLIAKGSIFGRPLVAYLDAGESATRSYAAFLVKTPPDFAGVESVEYGQRRIVVRERRQPLRELVIETGEIF